MKRPYVNFRELKAAVPIARVLERNSVLETLRERGEALSGPCPFCEGETSFRVTPAKNCFHCFSCKAGGNMLDFVALKEECSVRDAALKVAEWFGVETSSPSKGGQGGKRSVSKREPWSKAPPAAASPPKAGDAATGESKAEAGTETPEADSQPVEPGSGPQAGETPPQPNRPLTFELKLDPEHPWFAEVGLLPETVREFGLGFCSKGMMAGRICFPIRNASEQLLGYVGRWPGDRTPEGQPRWRYPKGLDLSQVVYPAERLPKSPSGRELFAGDPLTTILARQMGVEAYFVPDGGGLDACLNALARVRSR